MVFIPIEHSLIFLTPASLRPATLVWKPSSKGNINLFIRNKRACMRRRRRQPRHESIALEKRDQEGAAEQSICKTPLSALCVLFRVLCVVLLQNATTFGCIALPASDPRRNRIPEFRVRHKPCPKKSASLSLLCSAARMHSFYWYTQQHYQHLSSRWCSEDALVLGRQQPAQWMAALRRQNNCNYCFGNRSTNAMANNQI